MRNDGFRIGHPGDFAFNLRKRGTAPVTGAGGGARHHLFRHFTLLGKATLHEAVENTDQRAESHDPAAHCRNGMEAGGQDQAHQSKRRENNE